MATNDEKYRSILVPDSQVSEELRATRKEIRATIAAAKLAYAKRINPEGLAQQVFPNGWVVNLLTPLESIRFLYSVFASELGGVVVEYAYVGVWHIGSGVSRKGAGTVTGETVYDALISMIVADCPPD